MSSPPDGPSRPPEAWLRGPVPGIVVLLQPVAHALIQAREEVARAVADFPDESLWTRPAGAASVGFHLRHLAGVLDRLFTYARNEALDEEQRAFLAHEAVPEPGRTTSELYVSFHRRVDQALDALGRTRENVLTEPRPVGRLERPSTVAGLLFHAAEHTMRHTGQLIVTARVVGAANFSGGER